MPPLRTLDVLDGFKNSRKIEIETGLRNHVFRAASTFHSNRRISSSMFKVARPHATRVGAHAIQQRGSRAGP